MKDSTEKEQNIDNYDFGDYELFDKMIEEQQEEPQEEEFKSDWKPTKRNEGKSMIFEVSKSDRLLDFLFENIKNQSKTTVRSYLKHRQIAVNGTPTTKFDTVLFGGDTVEINLGTAKDGLSHQMLQIVYEDDYIIIVNKRQGLLTMATDKQRTRTAYFILSEYLKKQDSSNRVFIVHRLDRETSGLVIFAKSMEIQHTLQQNWSNIVLERKYIAVVGGSPKEQQGEIRSYLAENKALVMYSTRDSSKGELAITRYKVLNQNKTKSLLELELETGKKNQIRVHMQDIGCPIIGDKKYGGEIGDMDRVALHASKIRFIHPVTNKEMVFDTGIPSKFKKPFVEFRKR